MVMEWVVSLVVGWVMGLASWWLNGNGRFMGLGVGLVGLLVGSDGVAL